jgi:RNA polymerase sigma-70 factor (ECF subfamily)
VEAERVLAAKFHAGSMPASIARPAISTGETAFEAVFQSHYRRLVRSLSLACGDRELAADLVQQAFAQLWVDWPRISRYESPATWVARVAISRLRDHQRSVRRAAAALLRLGRQEDSRRDEAVERLDITAALARLPLQQRLAVVLFYLDDRPVQQVASIMGVSDGTVNQHLFRARGALRRYLKED